MMAKKSIRGVGSGSHCSTRRFRPGKRGHRQYIDRNRSAGRPRGTWNTKPRPDPATRSSDKHCDNRKRQSQPFSKEFDTANKCGSKERAGLSEIVACCNVRALLIRFGLAERRPDRRGSSPSSSTR
jgi:hypothetical protein